ncbi:MAG: hypothetical protein AAB873_00195 [Patescibacteria group bacterium]
MKKKIKFKIFLSSIFALLLFTFPLSSNNIFAQVMQGTTYRISSDSINFGGVKSSGTLYGLSDTLGELGTGASTGTLYALHAGFWATAGSPYITLSSPSDLTLDAISATGVSREGLVSWTVTTNNGAGYVMTIKSSTTPAFKSSTDYFNDYTPSGSDPDYDFSISTTGAEFGFSPEGTDTHSRFKDNGSACNTGSGETSGKCWDGLYTSTKTIATKTSGNAPSGSTVSVRFKASIGESRNHTAGNYSTSITVTATTL